MRQPFVAGNWKMHGALERNRGLVADIAEGAAEIDGVQIAICPPFVYLDQVHALLGGSGVALGAQNGCAEPEGAFTGEVAMPMLQDFACRYVIVGHSERRQYYHEDDALVGRKAARAVSCGITPIICIGETLAQREAEATESVVTGQLQGLLDSAGHEVLGKAVIAYEPIWAIGTGRTATPEQAQAVHAGIRRWLGEHDIAADALPLLYGGSVKPDNAAELFAQADIDGGLIGGASLEAASFLDICRAAARVDR